ncbi:TRAP transporter small permease [Acuticoccus sp. I52.16.1]|uniref:TRAP transporter small permease n=1 Tax=Acuticoccus sp. I52.16.1 TaxID=2928472 RepID=UPI001FD29B70|nr:TRAP transporter small permease [Acuticoccus sp. I52.16.1]UOM33251.1 TRAP transporter small permease [Acuticoccus sp. I52.16.1]
MADGIAAVLAAVLTVVFAVMIALVFLQVVDRFAPWFSYFWTEEVVRILLVWTVMLGLPVVLYIHGEIIVDLLPLPPAATIWRLRLATLLGAVFLGFLAWYGYKFAAQSANFRLPTLGISRGWIYAPIPIGAALGILALLVRRESGAHAYPLAEGDDTPVNFS